MCTLTTRFTKLYSWLNHLTLLICLDQIKSEGFVVLCLALNRHLDCGINSCANFFKFKALWIHLHILLSLWVVGWSYHVRNHLHGWFHYYGWLSLGWSGIYSFCMLYLSLSRSRWAIIFPQCWDDLYRLLHHCYSVQVYFGSLDSIWHGWLQAHQHSLIAPSNQLSSKTGIPIIDPTTYGRLVGMQQYLTLSRLDIAFVVS